MENEREFTQVIRFRPVEWALLVYLVFTGLLNIVYFKTLGATWVHLGARITIFSGLMLLIILQIRFNSRFIDFLRSFYPLATLGYLYGETDFYNNIWHNYLDAWFEKTDFFIFGFQPSIRFSEVFHWTWFQELMSLSYMSYFLMIFGVLWAIYRFNREYFNRSIFIVLQAFFFYYLIFIVLPVQGPQFWFPAPLNGLPEGGVFHKLLRFIQSVGERPTGAFPSSHVGISVILCYLSYQYARPLFRWMLGILVLLSCSAVYIKAHYFIDIVGGLLTAPLMILLTTSLLSLFSERSREWVRTLHPAGIFLFPRRNRNRSERTIL
ncbi:MAG: phosphatase PAP2 family protein [Bacteroidales bacterium]